MEERLLLDEAGRRAGCGWQAGAGGDGQERVSGRQRFVVGQRREFRRTLGAQGRARRLPLRDPPTLVGL